MYLRAGLCALIFSVTSIVGTAQTETFSVDDLAWLKGCWASTNGRVEINEQWMAPAGQIMLGMGRTVVGNATVEFEFLQIKTEANGEISYVARPSNQLEASFKLVKLRGQEAVFENPDHDFPQRIIYRLESDGSLIARIEGVDKGKERGVNYPMKRAFCDPPMAPPKPTLSLQTIEGLVQALADAYTGKALAKLDSLHPLKGKLKIVIEHSLSEDTYDTRLVKSWADAEAWLKSKQRDELPARSVRPLIKCTNGTCTYDFDGGILHNNLYLKRITYGIIGGKPYIKSIWLLDGD